MWVQRVRNPKLPLLPKKRLTDDRNSSIVKPVRVNYFQTKQNTSDFWEPVSEDLYGREMIETNVITLSEPHDNRPFARIKIYEVVIKALLDSGSQITLINEKTYLKLKREKPKLLPCPTIVCSANGTELTVLGQVYLPFTFADRVKVIHTLIVKHLSADCILGMDFWQKYSIWPTMQECNLRRKNYEK